MSIRQHNLGSIVKPGFNALGAQTSTNTYTYNLVGWGKNDSGQLGLSSTTYYSSPVQVGALTNWISTTNGTSHTAAIKTDGTLWAWGRGLVFGALGLGNLTNYSSPKQVGALTNWLKISANRYFNVAVKTDGTLWSWGENNFGQLGLGTVTNYSSPKQIGALTDWLSVSCGAYHVIATKTNNTLWAWGRNDLGQLGTGNIVVRSSPVQVGALTTWNKVSGGFYHTLATTTSNALWSWGDNSTGALGSGTITNRSSPVQVGALTTWLTITGGNYTSFGISSTGTLWSWGQNTNGRLGLGNTTNYSSPKQVGALTTWGVLATVASAGSSMQAIKTDGTFWVWGQNNKGQLGLGNVTSYSSPKQVGALTTWLSASAGTYFVTALLY